MLHFWNRGWICATAVLAAVNVASGSGPASFNYPDPPKEGRADYFTISEGGSPRCVIVRAKRSRPAADLLKAYLDLATGASIPLVDDGKPVPEGMRAIHVGDTAVAGKVELNLPALHYGTDVIGNLNGYLVQTLDENTLVIRGVNERATTLGVVGFLRRYAGVRHYWAGTPGDIGDVVPAHAKLTVPEVTWRDWPYFVSRIMSGLSEFGPARAGANTKVQSVDFFRLNYTIPSNESYYRWIRAEPHGREHPEYFPLFEGKRFIPGLEQRGKTARVQQGWQPCVSNPDLPKVVADQLIEYFDKNPAAIAINLAVNDGNGDCQCGKCAAMDAPGADMANRIGLCDRYIKFDNAVCDLVARKYPEKIIAFIAYGSMSLPPQTVKLHPMLLPVLTMGSAKSAFESWDSWMKTGARRMGIYLYHDDQSFFIMPKMDVHQSAKRIRYIVDSGLARHFYQEMYPFWPIDGMVPYVENELLWDPRQNVDAILDEYYTKFFGPAAGPMKRFYEILEGGYHRWLEVDGVPHPFGKDLGGLAGGRTFEQFKALTAEEANQAEAILAEAVKIAKPDARVVQRVDVVQRLFGFAAIGARQYALINDLAGARVQAESDARMLLAKARELVALSRAQGRYKHEVMEQPPANLYAVFGSPSSHSFYHDINDKTLNPQVALAISKALAAAASSLGEKLGPKKSSEWWHAQMSSEKDSFMRDALTIAASRASGRPLENLVKDPGYEQRGLGISPRTGKPAADYQTDHGVYSWHRTGTPFSVSLANGEAHTGRFSVLLNECGKAVVSESASSLKGGCFHLEVWLKHNDRPGVYQVQVSPTGAAGKTTSTLVNVPFQPGVWQKIEMDYPAPAGTRAIALSAVAAGQAPGAKLWIDDFFIGRYEE